MDKKVQDEVLNYLREASFRNNLIASKDLADLLFARIDRVEESQGIKDLKESINLYKLLAKSGSPDGYYGYYAVYRFTQDKDKLFYGSLTAQDLQVNESTAVQYLNEAIKLGHKQALFEFAETVEGSIIAADIYNSRLFISRQVCICKSYEKCKL